MSRATVSDLSATEHASRVSDALDEIMSEETILDLIREAKDAPGDACDVIMDALKECVRNRVERNLERDQSYEAMCEREAEDVA
jgi:hypothetical protein